MFRCTELYSRDRVLDKDCEVLLAGVQHLCMNIRHCFIVLIIS